MDFPAGHMASLVCLLVGVLVTAASAAEQPAQTAVDDLLAGRFRWKMSDPLIAPVERPEDPCVSVKDPSVLFHDGKWHVFCSIRSKKRTHQIEYLSFADWKDAAKAEHKILKASDGYFCAPQVFYFTPQKKWYLICQASDPNWTPKYQPAFSTNADVADVNAWSKVAPLGAKPAAGKAGLDFWIICDDKLAHLFFTTLDGKMWREETPLDKFPAGWSDPVLAIQGDIFEAGHVYKIKGLDKYLTVVEAQGGHGWRYFKAYLADKLEGPWKGIADSKDKSFASMANVVHPAARWTDSISHGELIRSGVDQSLEIDPADLRVLFQGVADKDRNGKPYGDIPWRLGLLQSAPAN